MVLYCVTSVSLTEVNSAVWAGVLTPKKIGLPDVCVTFKYQTAACLIMSPPNSLCVRGKHFSYFKAHSTSVAFFMRRLSSLKISETWLKLGINP